jgi:hypothetical protein
VTWTVARCIDDQEAVALGDQDRGGGLDRSACRPTPDEVPVVRKLGRIGQKGDGPRMSQNAASEPLPQLPVCADVIFVVMGVEHRPNRATGSCFRLQGRQELRGRVGASGVDEETVDQVGRHPVDRNVPDQSGHLELGDFAQAQRFEHNFTPSFGPAAGPQGEAARSRSAVYRELSALHVGPPSRPAGRG